jgi:opacity protein-like surface antigen
VQENEVRRNLVKRVVVFLSVLSVGYQAFAYQNSERRLRFHLKLTGGVSSLAVGDWNTYMDRATRLERDLGSLLGNEVQGQFEKIRTSPEIEGEFIVSFTPRFSIGVGVGLTWRKQGADSSRIFITSRVGKVDMTHETKISAVPVTVCAHYTFPLLPKVNAFVTAGLGYYYASWSDIYSHRLIGTWEERVEQSAQGQGFGIHGGAGVEYGIFSNMSIVVQASGRLAKINELKGEYDYVNSGGWADFYTGTLHYYEQDFTFMGLDWYSIVKILKEPHTSPAYRNVRKASLDFSGFRLQLGLKITL